MSRTGRVLVLGGTGEARRLATALVADDVEVLSSLAGRIADPQLPPLTGAAEDEHPPGHARRPCMLIT